MANPEYSVAEEAQIVVDTADFEGLPTPATIRAWVSNAMFGYSGDVFLSFVSSEQSRKLNKKFRNVDAPTNVLSFPTNVPSVLGDVAICTEVVIGEAESTGKSLDAHLAHLVTHGVLHLCGYDHSNEVDAEIMESKEVALLESIGVPNPYE